MDFATNKIRSFSFDEFVECLVAFEHAGAIEALSHELGEQADARRLLGEPEDWLIHAQTIWASLTYDERLEPDRIAIDRRYEIAEEGGLLVDDFEQTMRLYAFVRGVLPAAPPDDACLPAEALIGSLRSDAGPRTCPHCGKPVGHCPGTRVVKPEKGVSLN